MTSLWDWIAGRKDEDDSNLREKLATVQPSGLKPQVEAEPQIQVAAPDLTSILKTPPASAPETIEEPVASPGQENRTTMSGVRRVGANTAGIDSVLGRMKEKASAMDTSGAAQNHVDLLSRMIEGAKQDPSFQRDMSSVNDRIQKLDQQKQTLKDLHVDSDTKIGWLSALERIGQSLTQYAAARYGLEKGVNLAGLKMDKTDWQAMLDRSQKQLAQDMSELHDLRKEVVAEGKELTGRAEDLGKVGATAQLGAEKEKRSTEMDVLERELGAETSKANMDLQAQQSNLNTEYKEAALAARGNPQDIKALDKVKAIEQKDIELDLRKLTDQEKALSIAQAYSANIAAARSSNEKQKQLQLLSQSLGKAGIDPSTVSTMQGWISKHSEVNPEIAAKEIINELNEVRQKRQNLSNIKLQTQKAQTLSELDGIHNQRVGGGSPVQHPTTAPVAPTQDQEALNWAKANPQDPRAKAILEANGVR